MNIQSDKELGAYLRRRRKGMGLTIEDFASVIPCSPRLLSELERGQRGVSIALVMKMLPLLGLNLDLRGREEAPIR